MLIEPTPTFKKDKKHVLSQNKDMSKLTNIIEILKNNEELPKSYRNHKLKGKLKNQFECHIEKNWLLIYIKVDNKIILKNTGSHQELFSKY